MNSFDEIQCEETPNAQLCFNMEEMAFYQEWMEQQERDAQSEFEAWKNGELIQEELDYDTDLIDAEIDF